MQVNGTNPMRPYMPPQTQTKKGGTEETKPQGPKPSQDTYTPSATTQDTYTPSAISTFSVAETEQSNGIELESTYASAKEYNYALLAKYEGMTEYNITVSDELLEKAMNDSDTAEMLEEYISAIINVHDNYDGTWQRVHTETHIEDISSTGKVNQETLHVFASDDDYAALFDEKNDMEAYTNSIERMLVENATTTGGTMSDDEAAMLEKVFATFDEVYNGENASTGYSNFLNKALLNAGNITQSVIDDNERIMGDVSALKDEISSMLESEDLTKDVRTALEEALTRCDDILGGNSPLYDVITEDIPVTFQGRLNKEEYDASRPDLSLSVFGEEGSTAAMESFKEYMMKSNANLISLLIDAADSSEQDDVLAEFYENLQKIIDEKAEAKAEAEAEAEKEAALEESGEVDSAEGGKTDTAEVEDSL